jgi:hypothetical protein
MRELHHGEASWKRVIWKKYKKEMTQLRRILRIQVVRIGDG